LEPQVKESQGGDQVSAVLPENETEEKEEILLTPSTVEPVKPKMSSSFKGKSSRTMRQDKISSADVREQLERQTTQIDKIRPLLQSAIYIKRY
jgi:hypothetical protein